ncbi:MAG: DNA primase [Methylacidiphilales bacterium]|nr:DNA primase [Candidatus Methylacidiphilales bacterium]
MAIPPHVIDQVRQAVDIVDVIGGYVPLKRAGASFKALSPFNKEKTPSFFVSPQRQTFKCFSSGHGGDVFKFLMLYENMDFPSAVRRLAERAGIRIEEDRSPTHDREKQNRDRLLALHVEIASYWRELLLHDPQAEPARAYMHSREIPQSWIKEFGLGYVPNAWDDTLKWGKSKGYDEKILLEAGLVVRNESGRVYDRFRGRLIFNICNDQGHVIAFSARLLDAEAKAAKYINSPETPIFTKSRVLFGLERAKRPIMDAGHAVVCEGQIDVLRCHAAGVLNVVAPLGTAFTPEHARMIRRYTKEVVLCLDADKAGLNAAERVAQIFLGQADSLDAMIQSELGVRVVRLPEGHDPDSLIRSEGAEAFRKILEHPLEYLDFYLERLEETHDMNTMGGRREVIESVAAFLARIPNRVYREQLLLKAALRLQVSDAILLERIEALVKQSRKVPVLHGEEEAKPKVTVARVLQPHPRVGDLIQLIMSQPQHIPEVQKQLDPAWVRDLAGAPLLLKLMDFYNDEEWQSVTPLLSRLEDEEQNYLAELNVEGLKERTQEPFMEMLAKIIAALRVSDLSNRIVLLTRKLSQPGLSDSEKAALKKEWQELNQQKNSLTART